MQADVPAWAPEGREGRSQEAIADQGRQWQIKAFWIRGATSISDAFIFFSSQCQCVKIVALNLNNIIISMTERTQGPRYPCYYVMCSIISSSFIKTNYHPHHHQAGPWKSNCNRGKLELCRYLADETWSPVTLLLIQSIKYFFQIYLSLNLVPADETWSHLVIHNYLYFYSQHILSSIFIFHCVLHIIDTAT